MFSLIYNCRVVRLDGLHYHNFCFIIFTSSPLLLQNASNARSKYCIPSTSYEREPHYSHWSDWERQEAILTREYVGLIRGVNLCCPACFWHPTTWQRRRLVCITHSKALRIVLQGFMCGTLEKIAMRTLGLWSSPEHLESCGNIWNFCNLCLGYALVHNFLFRRETSAAQPCLTWSSRAYLVRTFPHLLSRLFYILHSRKSYQLCVYLENI